MNCPLFNELYTTLHKNCDLKYFDAQLILEKMTAESNYFDQSIIINLLQQFQTCDDLKCIEWILTTLAVKKINYNQSDDQTSTIFEQILYFKCTSINDMNILFASKILAIARILIMSNKVTVNNGSIRINKRDTHFYTTLIVQIFNLLINDTKTINETAMMYYDIYHSKLIDHDILTEFVQSIRNKSTQILFEIVKHSKEKNYEREKMEIIIDLFFDVLKNKNYQTMEASIMNALRRYIRNDSDISWIKNSNLSCDRKKNSVCYINGTSLIRNTYVLKHEEKVKMANDILELCPNLSTDLDTDLSTDLSTNQYMWVATNTLESLIIYVIHINGNIPLYNVLLQKAITLKHQNNNTKYLDNILCRVIEVAMDGTESYCYRLIDKNENISEIIDYSKVWQQLHEQALKLIDVVPTKYNNKYTKNFHFNIRVAYLIKQEVKILGIDLSKLIAFYL